METSLLSLFHPVSKDSRRGEVRIHDLSRDSPPSFTPLRLLRADDCHHSASHPRAQVPWTLTRR